MNNETLKTQLLKQARNAFETASTLRENQRIEVYSENGEAKVSNTLEDNEEIVYSSNKVLCYSVYGHEYLGEEIKAWIDYARVIPQPSTEIPVPPEPTDIEKSIRELNEEIAKRNGVNIDSVSSFEIFANLPMDLLGSIEQQIIEYWWSAKEEENGKTLALEQIEAVLERN